MAAQSVPIDGALDAYGRTQFGIADILRRVQGHVFGAFGLDPIGCPYRVIASGPFWRLRDYNKNDASQSLLIVAAPIKRPYIWDLTPTASAIRYCLGQGLRVRLLEWLLASRTSGNNGLSEYTEAISNCVAKISGENAGSKPFLIGHSLGRYLGGHIRRPGA
jgi:polyhydroxyalkanoate synthase subunit PhaC